MKKYLSVAAVLVCGYVTYAFVNPTVENYTTENGEKVSVEKVEITDEEALYCDITVGGNSGTCWFCDCDELADKLKKK